VEVFSKDKEETIPPHQSTDSAIDLETGYDLPYGRIHNLSEFELRMLKAYIRVCLVNRYIQRLSSLAAAPIFFGKEKDGGLKLFVDYRVLNLAMVKNQYPLQLISEILYRIGEARICMKLDLRDAYNLIQIKEGDKYRMASRSHYGQLQYWVIPFGLTHALATFESYIDDCLWPYIDDFLVCYLNHIIIHSTNEEGHEEHVQQVMQRHKEFGLYCKAEKC